MSEPGATPSKASGSAAPSAHALRPAAASEIADLAREVYGDGVADFMATPRRSLGRRTPREAIAAGELDAVRQVLINALEGTWA